MNKRVIGILLLIFGAYLSLVNPIFSMVFNQVNPIGFYVPIEPLEYWVTWLFMYGYITIMPALLGVCLIIYGYRFIREAAKVPLKSSG